MQFQANNTTTKHLIKNKMETIFGIIGFIVICAVAFKVIKHIVIAIKETFKSE